MSWLLYIVLGVLLIVLGFSGAVLGDGVDWFQLAIGAILIAMGVDKRRRT
jgi:hypothetical protein